MMPQLIMVSTFGVGLTTAGAGVVRLFGVVPPPEQGLPCVITSLPILILTWYLWAVNDIVQKIRTSGKDPGKQLEQVSAAFAPILTLLRITAKAPEKDARLTSPKKGNRHERAHKSTPPATSK